MNIKELIYNNVAKDRKTLIGMAASVFIFISCFITLFFYLRNNVASDSGQMFNEGFMIGLLFLIPLIIAFWYMVSENDPVKQYDRHYAEHLSHYSCNVLSKATESPELDDETKQIITSHLNSNNPGWSFEGATQ